MDRIGVIQIGSNSIRFMLTEVEDSGYFRVIDELSSSIKLCSDLIDNDVISEEKIELIISTLKSYKSLCNVSGAKKIIAVASSSLNDAKNKEYIFNKINSELNIDAKLLSSYEEIYYTYLGIVNSMYFKNALLVDITGNSTNLAHLCNGKIINSYTIPLGSVNTTYKYHLQDRIVKEDLDNALIEINKYLETFSKLIGIKYEAIIGVGGTVRCLARIDRRRKKYPLSITHQYVTSDYDIHDIFNIVKSKNLVQRRRLDGMSPKRPDIIVGGATLFQSIINFFSVEKIIVSGRGLKEGLMFEYIQKKYGPINDILDYSLNGIVENLNINKAHAKHVYWLTKKLFEKLKPVHKLTKDYGNVIKTASILHDCGTSIDYYNHHLHSFYVILNSYINGLTHKELLESAAVAASHRNNNYHLCLPKYCSLINKLDVDAIEKIGVILKIAEGLDRSLEGSVKDIDVSISNDSVTINAYSDIDLFLEIQQAMRCARPFKDVFNKTLTIVKA